MNNGHVIFNNSIHSPEKARARLKGRKETAPEPNGICYSASTSGTMCSAQFSTPFNGSNIYPLLGINRQQYFCTRRGIGKTLLNGDLCASVTRLQNYASMLAEYLGKYQRINPKQKISWQWMDVANTTWASDHNRGSPAEEERVWQFVGRTYQRLLFNTASDNL